MKRYGESELNPCKYFDIHLIDVINLTLNKLELNLYMDLMNIEKRMPKPSTLIF